MAKIYITGITGFLGSNIARYLIEDGHEFMATYRASSSRRLCADFWENVKWVDQDNNHWINEVCYYKPEIIIHAAWIGVGHEERNDWNKQFLNICYLKDILDIAKLSNTSKFIGLGSRAEYGSFDGVVDESHLLNPTEAYGCAKVICSEIVKQCCNYHNINWYWLRLFSFFGKGEAENWLIPSLVKKMLTDTEMDFTPGEQKYAYLYVNDLAFAVNNIICKQGKSGIYNVSGKNLLELKYLIKNIRNLVNDSFRLNFGALSYRPNQPMLMYGDTRKFVSEFGEFEISNFNNALFDTIEYLKKYFGTK